MSNLSPQSGPSRLDEVAVTNRDFMSARPRNLGPLARMRAEGLPPQYFHHPLRCARGLRVGCRARGAHRPLFCRSQFYAIAALTSRSLRRHPPGPSEGIVVIRRVALRGVAAGGSNMGGSERTENGRGRLRGRPGDAQVRGASFLSVEHRLAHVRSRANRTLEQTSPSVRF